MLGYIYDIILSPIVTEKTNTQLNNRKYSFSISGSASKEDIKKSIETIFGVDVEKINIINTEGKVKRFKGTIGKRSSVKKAIVTIKNGQEINFAKLEDK
ncbi:MAG: 50S ribosomal protein L23 [Rickettsiales bacterium]|nr:50S ribosomal protein L23 [Rickettsiales bacterium]